MDDGRAVMTSRFIFRRRRTAPSDTAASTTWSEGERTKERLAVLLAEWGRRHDEIAVRSSAENYNFVLVVTSLATVGALYALFRTNQNALAGSLPLLTAIGALLMSVLPVNLAHIASSTELRRHYLELRVEPQIREIILAPDVTAQNAGPLMTFEQFDRYEHKGLYNSLIFVRSLFAAMPSLLLAGFCIALLVPKLRVASAVPVALVAFTLLALAFASMALALFALISMRRRTVKLRERHPDDGGMVSRWASPRGLLKHRNHSG
jgi:hypothetical protein